MSPLELVEERIKNILEEELPKFQVGEKSYKNLVKLLAFNRELSAYIKGVK